MLGVEFRQMIGGQGEFVVRGAYSNGTRILLGNVLSFEYGEVYFVDCWLDGPARAFQADLYEGTDDTGSLVGTIAVELDPLLALQLDSLGLSNITGDHDRQMHLSLGGMSYVPEPATLGLLGMAGLGLLRRKRIRGR